jgi:hypothetical protein
MKPRARKVTAPQCLTADRDIWADDVGIAGGEDANRQQRPESDDPVDRDRAYRVIDAEALQQLAGVRDQEAADGGDHERQCRVIDVEPRCGGDHAGEAARDAPERLAARGEVCAHDAAREAHEDVEHSGRKVGRRAVDVEEAVTRVDDAAHQEAEEADVDEHEGQHRHREVVAPDRE